MRGGRGVAGRSMGRVAGLHRVRGAGVRCGRESGDVKRVYLACCCRLSCAEAAGRKETPQPELVAVLDVESRVHGGF